MKCSVPWRFSCLLLTTGIFSLAAAGCGRDANIIPVEGKVTDLEGQVIPELAGFTVEFESLEAKVSAVGEIQADGSFRMTTKRSGDGAWRGKHKVLIIHPDSGGDVPVPKVILPKYEKYETSELEAIVESGGNPIIFKVERIKRKKT